MIEIIYSIIGFRIIKPKCIDAKIVVILLTYIPYIFSGFRIKWIDLYAVSLKIIGLCGSALCPDQQPAL